ncbi:sulfotransferase [Rhodovulum sulfidophilum]|uniref:sulfotransferase family protein n=1 Tax=Rhodovulum sulfidophilum TaxID=35806 RepID=UPI001922ABF3|nr:sulfotransferase [Rhodovulum sulfidophilum]MBL3563681.1 sulfotransferase [Rhodovulum sulfidophilum]
MTGPSTNLQRGIGSPVFVVGNPRSGTTLFRLILTAHSKVGIAPETAFIIRLYPRYGHVKRFDERTLDRFEADLNRTSIDLESHWKTTIRDLFARKEDFVGRSYPEVCAQLYRNFHKVRGLGPVEIWGDKNNAYGNYLDVLNHLFPTARFIHVVRDGRAVFNSYKKLPKNEAHKYAPALPRDARAVSLRWVDMVSRIDRQLARKAPGRHLAVRYEDVLQNFQPTMDKVCAFMGLEYQEAMRGFDQLNRKFELEPHEYGWKENTFKPLDPDKTSSWRTELGLEEIAIFERESAEVLTHYGYRLETQADSSSAGRDFRPEIVKGRAKEFMRSARFTAIRARSMIGL